ncbi:uncharacterized protein LOC134263294 isoform X3 [Saccostrea cucullata]|uniref:uncharacterized protein LOC134263294 isoform X3 n=1 Tax=Saccostrea cuccullata TaxID=36930 RepID=UPI002ED5569D
MKLTFVGILQTICLVTDIRGEDKKNNCTMPTINNGYARIRSRGRLVRFFCKKRFKLHGTEVSYCRNGEWIFPTPVCIDEEPKKSCNFEKADLCSWVQDKSDTTNFDWIRTNAVQLMLSNRTGPNSDHTYPNTNTGHYFLMEASIPREPGDYTTLFSPYYSPVEAGLCFEFWYHMHGRDGEGNLRSLHIGIKDTDADFPNFHSLWNISGNQGTNWQKGSFEIGERASFFQIVITGTRGEDHQGNIAIDDVSITNCTRVSTISACKDGQQIMLQPYMGETVAFPKNYPLKKGYEANLKCTWNINAIEGYEIVVYPQWACESEASVHLYYGSSEVLLKFMTYSPYTEGGFQFRFMAVEKNRINTCDSSNKTLLAESTPQYIISPGFPSAYPSNLQCSWSVESALKKDNIRLVFEFRSQNIEEGYDGCADYVKINGLENFCEEWDKYILRTSDRIILNNTTTEVRFVSDFGYAGSGFVLAFYFEDIVKSCYCQHGGTCSNSTCLCPRGYKGGYCETDIDECEEPAICHHKCENTQGSYICSCMNGYKLINERDCQDIDECASADHDCDQCYNFPGAFQCLCSEGYRLNATTKMGCYNIDECFEHIDDCSENALCIDTDGSFNCSFLSGFKGNGLTCTGCANFTFGDSCSDRCACASDKTATCDAVDGVCRCLSGWSGLDCSEDIDECSEGIHNCSTVLFQICVNTPGSFYCECLFGWRDFLKCT